MTDIKNCAFQYWANGKMVEDTGLITREKADALWDRYIPEFKANVERGDDPEMALWVDMAEQGDYHTTARHWRGHEFFIKDGDMYLNVPVA